mmetsp:Transcript_9612/g.24708  ORF Transcript_9612/g.24708 Transcript_9612/m.24708 type:complete len:215 (-) Transcript_9612:811-1455(-)
MTRLPRLSTGSRRRALCGTTPFLFSRQTMAATLVALAATTLFAAASTRFGKVVFAAMRLCPVGCCLPPCEDRIGPALHTLPTGTPHLRQWRGRQSMEPDRLLPTASLSSMPSRQTAAARGPRWSFKLCQTPPRTFTSLIHKTGATVQGQGMLPCAIHPSHARRQDHHHRRGRTLPSRAATLRMLGSSSTSSRRAPSAQLPTRPSALTCRDRRIV